MNQNEFKQFLQVQSEEMLKHKWIMSEKANHDLGQEAITDWIRKYAKDFRKFWQINHPDIN